MGQMIAPTIIAAIGCMQPWINIFQIMASKKTKYLFFDGSGLSKSYNTAINKCKNSVNMGILTNKQTNNR